MENMNYEVYAGIKGLIEEVKSGEHEKDTLPNSSLEFSEERQAQYFSNLRKNMHSDIAGIIMTNMQQLDELQLIKEWRVK